MTNLDCNESPFEKALRLINQTDIGWNVFAVVAEMSNGERTIIEKLLKRRDAGERLRKQVEREGIPNKLQVSDEFGYWFSGLFDGEGTLHAGGEFRLGVSITLRDDDFDVLWYIKKTLRLGNLNPVSIRKPGQNPAVRYSISGIKCLAHVVVPLFSQYPLKTKKGKEFEVWKRLVEQVYTYNLRGDTKLYRLSGWVDRRELGRFDAGVKEVRSIREYKEQPLRFKVTNQRGKKRYTLLPAYR